ncbi:MAG: protease inhibitor I42 family protein [Candidatus Competibacteraceae bacterium]|nr:protease inhibitor I42 family protein [Candidatus Competibacteraceae bacterium]
MATFRVSICLFPVPKEGTERLPFRSFLLGMALLVILVHGGCATQGESPETIPAGHRENGVLVVTTDDNHRTAQLVVGEQLEVRLPENPETGFSWAIDENDRRILALDNTAYTSPAVAGFIGVRGQRVFTLTARRPGEDALKLKYWRVMGGDDSITERFAVTVRVVAAGKK